MAQDIQSIEIHVEVKGEAQSSVALSRVGRAIETTEQKAGRLEVGLLRLGRTISNFSQFAASQATVVNTFTNSLITAGVVARTSAQGIGALTVQLRAMGRSRALNLNLNLRPLEGAITRLGALRQEIGKCVSGLIRLREVWRTAWQAGIQASGGMRGSMGALVGATGRAAHGVASVGSAAQGAAVHVRGLWGSIISINQAMGVLRRAAFLIKDVGRVTVGMAIEFQNAKTRLTGLTGSAATAEIAFGRIRKIARETPFNIPDVLQASVRLAGFRIDVDKTLKSMADLAVFMRRDMKDAAYAYSRAFTGQGAAAMRMLRESGVMSIVDREITKKYPGISAVQMRYPTVVREGLEAMLQSQEVFGASDRLMAQFEGRLMNLEDAFTTLGASIGDSLVQSEAAKSALSILEGEVYKTADAVWEWVRVNRNVLDQRISEFVDDIRDKLSQLPQYIPAIFSIGEAFSSLGSLVFGAALQVAELINKLNSLAEVIKGIPGLGWLLQSGGVVGPLVAGGVAGVATRVGASALGAVGATGAGTVLATAAPVIAATVAASTFLGNLHSSVYEDEAKAYSAAFEELRASLPDERVGFFNAQKSDLEGIADASQLRQYSAVGVSPGSLGSLFRPLGDARIRTFEAAVRGRAMELLQSGEVDPWWKKPAPVYQPSFGPMSTEYDGDLWGISQQSRVDRFDMKDTAEALAQSEKARNEADLLRARTDLERATKGDRLDRRTVLDAASRLRDLEIKQLVEEKNAKLAAYEDTGVPMSSERRQAFLDLANLAQAKIDTNTTYEDALRLLERQDKRDGRKRPSDAGVRYAEAEKIRQQIKIDLARDELEAARDLSSERKYSLDAADLEVRLAREVDALTQEKVRAEMAVNVQKMARARTPGEVDKLKAENEALEARLSKESELKKALEDRKKVVQARTEESDDFRYGPIAASRRRLAGLQDLDPLSQQIAAIEEEAKFRREFGLPKKTDELAVAWMYASEQAKAYNLTAEETAQVQKRIVDSMNNVKSSGRAMFDELIRATEGWATSLSDSIADSLEAGKISFKSFFTDIGKQIHRMMINEFFSKPLMEAVAKMIGSVRDVSSGKSGIFAGIAKRAEEIWSGSGERQGGDVGRRTPEQIAAEGAANTNGIWQRSVESIRAGFASILGALASGASAFLGALLGGGGKLSIGGFFKEWGINFASKLVGTGINAALSGGGGGGESLTEGQQRQYLTAAFDVPFKGPGAYHTGGFAGLASNPLYFHGGGRLGADEVPAILQRGELVIPRRLAADISAVMGNGGVRRYHSGGFVGGSSVDGGSSGAVYNMPLQLSVTSLDPTEAANVIMRHEKQILAMVHRNIRRGGALAEATGSRGASR